nr:hypothetical protein [Rhizoctonia sp.]
MGGIMSFNKACTAGILFLWILILYPLPLTLRVQSNLNLSTKTSCRSFTPSKLKHSVHRIMAWVLLSFFRSIRPKNRGVLLDSGGARQVFPSGKNLLIFLWKIN